MAVTEVGKTFPDLPNNPIDRLGLVPVSLRSIPDGSDAASCRDVTEQLARWFENAVRCFLADGGSFDHALGLTGNLGRSPLFEYRRRQRDERLKMALQYLDGNFVALAKEVRVFEQRLWPRWRDSADPSPEWSDARKFIHAAFRIGVRVPATREGLVKALMGGN